MLKNISGFVFNPETNNYEYDRLKNFCFNTTELHQMGVHFWKDDDDYEQVNWYMKLSKCNNNTSEVTCKSTEEINEYIKGMVLMKFLK